MDVVEIALLRVTDPQGRVIPCLSPQQPYAFLESSCGERESGLDPVLWSQGLLERLGVQLHWEEPGEARRARRGEILHKCWDLGGVSLKQ